MRSAVYPERSRRGYTLIELLVVVSIIGIMSLVGFVSFRGISADQVAVKSAGELQSLLRLAQSNATSSTLCNNLGSLSWQLVFDIRRGPISNIDLQCSNKDTVKFTFRTYTLENAEISSITGSNSAGCSGRYTELIYSVGVGTLTFSDPNTCIKNSNDLTIIVRNKNNTALTKTITIYKGGRINVQ